MRARFASSVCLALALAACGRTEEPSVAAAEPVRREVDLDRPCTLVTPAIAEKASGLPLFRTLVADSVSEGHVTCAQAMGAGGILGVARVVVHLPHAAGPTEARFAALCRGDVRAWTEPVRAGPMRAITQPPPATTAQAGMCVLPGGGYALRLPDRVLEIAFETPNGGVDPDITVVLAQAIQARAQRATGLTPQGDRGTVGL